MIDFLNKHWIISTILSTWILGLFTFVFYIAFTSPPDMNAAVATVLTGMMTLPGLVIGLYKWRFEQHQMSKGRNDRDGADENNESHLR